MGVESCGMDAVAPMVRIIAMVRIMVPVVITVMRVLRPIPAEGKIRPPVAIIISVIRIIRGVIWIIAVIRIGGGTVIRVRVTIVVGWITALWHVVRISSLG